LAIKSTRIIYLFIFAVNPADCPSSLPRGLADFENISSGSWISGEILDCACLDVRILFDV